MFMSNHSLRARIPVVAVAMALTIGLPTVAATGEIERPSILLLVAEDMSLRVGAFGDPVAVTPNLDRLATEGVRYDNVFTAAGVCAPSRAALITGLHPNALGAGHMRSHGFDEAQYKAVPPPQVKAFPERLRAAGYFTYSTTKLDYQFSGTAPGQGPFTIWDAESRSNAGISWKDAPEGARFFGMYAFMETHESGMFQRFGWPRSVVQVVMGLLHSYLHRGVADVVAPEAVELPPYYPDTPEIRQDIARHYNNIHTMDLRVGALLEELERSGRADDTIVIWTTDHGDGLPRAKRELFDSGIRVPMIIRWPEKYRPADAVLGSIDHRLISFVDLGPQILAWAGVRVPETSPGAMHGRPFLERTRRDYVYAARDRIDEFPDRQRAVRDHRYKYIHNDYPGMPGVMRTEFRQNLSIMRSLAAEFEAGRMNKVQRLWFEPRGVEELYDLQRDPHEVDNRAADPEYALVLERMRAALAQWQERVPDLGRLDEVDLAERFWPGGVEPSTAVPTFESAAGRIRIATATEGASIGYRFDGGPWRLYVEPLPRPAKAVSLESKAVRYGWSESGVARFSPR
jgi:arylsulfatase A-like enzyme